MAFQKKFGFWQLAALLGILALGLLLVVYGTRPQTFDYRLKKAEKLWKQKSYDRAIQLYLNLIDEDPKNPRVPELLLQVGDIYNLSLGQIDKAIQTYDLVAVRYPSTNYALQAFVRKGELYFGSDQFEKALREYQNILENFPNLKDIDTYRLRLGICHIKLKQFEAARREFKAILDADLKTPLADQVLFHTANSYFLEGNAAQAIPIYQSLIDHYPKSSLLDEAKFNMADCYEDLGNFDRALAIYKEIQNTYPNPKVIELQIQRNQERRAEDEKHKEKILSEQKKALESRKAALLPGEPSALDSKKKLDLKIKRKDVIDDILKNY